MDMIIAGKCPPEREELEDAKERGFDQVELYLEKEHLDRFEESIENVKESDLEVVSIHTPHVHLENRGYIVLADQLAKRLDAYLVFHSQYMHHTHIPKLEELDIRSDYGYENNPGVSKTFLETGILNRGHEMVLDTAHFYLGDHDPGDLEEFLENHHSSLSVMHLCDSSESVDGLAFGEGVMDMEAVCKVIDESEFDGILVLEVMPEDQEDALEKWKRYTG